MGMLAPPWDDLSFALKRNAAWGAVGTAYWKTTCLYQIGSVFHTSTAEIIDTAISNDLGSNLANPLSAEDAGEEFLRICKIAYLPTTYTGIFLRGNISPLEAWIHL